MLRDEDIMAAMGKENEFVLGHLFFADVFKSSRGVFQRVHTVTKAVDKFLWSVPMGSNGAV